MNRAIRIGAAMFVLTLLGCTPTQTNRATQPQQVSTQGTPAILDAKIRNIAVVAIGNEYFPPENVENKAMEIFSRKGYAVASRSDLYHVLKEQKFQGSDLALRTENAVRAGQILNVDAIFILQATETRTERMSSGQVKINKLSVAGKLIEVRHGRILWIKNHTSQEHGLLISLLLLPVNILAGHLSNEADDAVNKILMEFPNA